MRDKCKERMIIMQNRLRSKIVWTSTASLLIFILKNYINLEIAKVDELINLILVLATVLGIFNNPRDKEEF